ncbi:MAG: MarR family winged helix-turn-helix transcriptional regulator [Oscillospiraceae bacterium]
MDDAIRRQLVAVNSAVNRTNELYGRWARRHRLNYNSLMILYYLQNTESCTQKQLCDSLLMPKQTVNSICKELESGGYLSLSAAADRRERTLRFTPAGHDYADALLCGLQAAEEQTMLKMGPELCSALIESNERFCAIFESEVENEQPIR